MRGNGVGTDKQVHLESPVLRGTDVVAGDWLHVDGCPMSNKVNSLCRGRAHEQPMHLIVDAATRIASVRDCLQCERRNCCGGAGASIDCLQLERR